MHPSPALQPRHWFVLDEFRAMERVDCIHDLLNRGRSKGAAVVLGIQSIEGLFELYGQHAANDLLTNCAQKIFLRAGGPKTAEWAEHFFGKVRRVEPVVSESWGRGGKTRSVQYNLQERSLFLSSYFLNLPLPTVGKPYVAVCDVPSLQRTLIIERPFEEVLAWCSEKSSVRSVDLRRNTGDQTLQPWTPEEEKAFCGAAGTRDKRRKKKSPSDGTVSKKDMPTMNDVPTRVDPSPRRL